jgi:hypothetical protein
VIPASLIHLKELHVQLISALDGDDVQHIEQAVRELAAGLDAVQAQGAWEDRPEVGDMVRVIFRLSEAARIRVNFLTDTNQQRLDALSHVCSRAVSSAYGSDGKRVL